MIKFETSKYYKVNQIDSGPAYVCSITKDFITVLYNHKVFRLKVRHGFFNDCEHVNIPTEYRNCNLFCVAVNAI